MHKTTPTIATAAVLLMPVAQIAGAAVAASPASAASTRTVSGPPVHMRWGDVTVTIKVSGRRLIDVQGSVPSHKPRSNRINGRALPKLRSEALRAQSARISSVSGATLTSNAYGSSLQAALRSAGI
jgi:uncharacterized protein with FMN-binding domain